MDEVAPPGPDAGLETDEQALRLLVAASPVGLFHAGLDGTITWVNERWRQITGCDLAVPLPFTAILDLVHDDDRARVATLLIDSDGSPVEVTTEVRLAPIAGSIRSIRLQASPITGPDGEVHGYVGTITDISELVADHDATRRREDRYRRLLLDAPVPQLLSELDGTLIEVNQAFCDLMGATADELMARDPRSLFHPDDLPLMAEHVRRIRRGETDRFEVERRMVRGDGTVRWVAGGTAVVRDGDRTCFHSVLQDVTDRKAAEQAVRDSEAKVRHVLDSLHEGVIVHDLHRVVAWNTAAVEITGIPADDISDLEAWAKGEPIHEDGRPMPLDERPSVQAMVTGERVSDVLVGFLHPTRGRRWLRSTATPTFEDGVMVGSVLSFSDETERKEAEDALRDSERRYRAVIESLHDGLIIHDGDQVLAANDAAARILGIDREALESARGVQGLPMVDRDGYPIPPDQRPAHRSLIDGVPCQDVLVGVPTKVRGLRWCVVNTVPLRRHPAHAPYAVAVSFADVTERLAAEDALRASEERYRHLVANAPMGYLVTDQYGHIVEVNRTVEDIFGVPASLVVGHEAQEWVHPDDLGVMLAHIEDLWNGRIDRYESEMRILLPGGDVRWVSVAGTLAGDRDDGEPSYLVLLQDITDRKRAEAERERLEAELAHQATHDSLTGLPNRAHLLELLEEALLAGGGVPADEAAEGVPADEAAEGVAADLAADGAGPAPAGPGNVALLFLDLDRFKQVNDTLGHEAGDELLTEVARRIATVLRPADLVARLGGDEFVLLCPGVTDEAQARALAQRVVSAVEASPVALGGAEVTITASVGIALSSGTGHPEALLRDADAAMYRAKELGRARLEVFDEAMRTRTAERIERADELAAALERDELVVLYQPTVDLRSGAVTAVEALVRWEHPRLGLLPPSEFIALAEDTGLIVGLGLKVLTTACAEARRWLDELGDTAPEVHVNLSARQLGTPNLARLVEGVLANTGLPPERLCLEVTESVLMEDAAESIEALHALDGLGVHLAIDDFGTGYSSLSYLRRFPVDVLKVDRSFVDGLGPDPEDSAIVAAIVNLAATLDLRAIAEGVETVEQLERLRALGCDAAQGFLFSRPVTAEAVRPLLTRPWA